MCASSAVGVGRSSHVHDSRTYGGQDKGAKSYQATALVAEAS